MQPNTLSSFGSSHQCRLAVCIVILIHFLSGCLKGCHCILSFSAIHKMRYQECGKCDEFGHSYFILLSLDRKTFTAINNIHNISYLWMGPVLQSLKSYLLSLIMLGNSLSSMLSFTNTMVSSPFLWD